MTGLEAMHLLRIMLDDGKEFFPTLTEAIAAINEAQNRLMRKWVAEGNERALRPLHTFTGLLDNGGTVNNALYVKGAYITYTTSDNVVRVYAKYVDYDTYLNYTAPGFDTGQAMPSTAYYTIHGDAANSEVYFTHNDAAQIIVLCIMQPPTAFAFSSGNQGFIMTFPKEFHSQIISLAAQIINDSDILENERSTPADPRQVLPLSVMTQ